MNRRAATATCQHEPPASVALSIRYTDDKVQHPPTFASSASSKSAWAWSRSCSKQFNVAEYGSTDAFIVDDSTSQRTSHCDTGEMAVTALQSPGRPQDKPNENNTGQFALLLVQEWLVACKLESTAHCLVDECARTERGIPARLVWNRMVENLGFGPRSPATGGKRSGGNTTMLEAVVRRVVDQHTKDVAQTIRSQALTPQQQVVVMSKRRELRFVNKRSLPRSRSAAPSNNAHDRSPDISSPSSSFGLRPKSAMVCKSTSDLVSKSLLGDSFKSRRAGLSVQTDLESLQQKKVISSNQRPISAASVLTPHQNSPARRNSIVLSTASPPRSPTSNSALHGVLEAVAAVAVDAAAAKTIARHNSTVVGLRASLPHITDISGPATSPGADDDNGGDTKGDAIKQIDDSPETSLRAPKLSLEEMSEERLMEQFGSISRCAIKKLRRVLAKSHACSQEFEKSQRTLDKIKARAKLRQLRRVLAEEQTPLLSSTMAPLTSEPCSLCLYVFPKTNLTTKVSYKSIVDLRASWAAANGSTATSGEVENNENTETTGQPAEGMNHARMTHLYDEAPVCVFCSQLVLNYSSYRVRFVILGIQSGHCFFVSQLVRHAQPSSAERRAQQIKERRETLKNLKDHLEAKERHDLERCDPLDFHSYELNSDDDDSDVEEIVVIKPDGRPQRLAAHADAGRVAEDHALRIPIASDRYAMRTGQTMASSAAWCQVTNKATMLPPAAMNK
ncbi:unnamed protein product [Phytophthora lilii]|uniref:Unnamed protein product n=1 Tax=Phytophthora lilii TaxID=2077276 RepID=A0A9W6TP64_9STRA|nr:unnamed protein product [Phytophthora lilii]